MIKYKIIVLFMILVFCSCANQQQIENKVFTVKSEKILFGKTICIDPGHGITDVKMQEKMSPISNIMKEAYVKGTSGKNLTEEKLNLIVALKLKKVLEDNGAKVIMTREISEITISNIERANMANNRNVDLAIHIHADYSPKESVHGVSVLVPSGNLLGEPTIEEQSLRLGNLILEKFVLNTGAENKGISPRSDLTGFNWSKIPTALIELGFMSNNQEEELMETDSYQDKMVEGIYNGITSYLSN